MIRKSTAEDCPAVYGLICELEEQQFPYAEFARIYLEQQDDERYCCLVYADGGVVQAVMNMRCENQLHHTARIAEIMELCVSAPQRGRGLGGQLFRAACAAAAERGCQLIELATNQRRHDAHRFYLRHGLENLSFKFTQSLDSEQLG